MLIDGCLARLPIDCLSVFRYTLENANLEIGFSFECYFILFSLLTVFFLYFIPSTRLEFAMSLVFFMLFLSFMCLISLYLLWFFYVDAVVRYP